MKKPIYIYYITCFYYNGMLGSIKFFFCPLDIPT